MALVPLARCLMRKFNSALLLNGIEHISVVGEA